MVESSSDVVGKIVSQMSSTNAAKEQMRNAPVQLPNCTKIAHGADTLTARGGQSGVNDAQARRRKSPD
jgi:hypothetical protein